MLKSVNKLYYTACLYIYTVNCNAKVCKQSVLYILYVNTCTLSILHITKTQQFYNNNNNNRFYSTQSTKINKNLKI